MARREFSARVKVAAYERSKGFCEMCGCQLKPGRVEYDHRIADALGGEPTLENCVACCIPCHSEKTRTKDIPAAAWTKRQQAKELGIRPKSRWPKNPDPWQKQRRLNHH